MPYRVINIYYSVMCYNNHINSTRIQSIASMALMVFPDGNDINGGGVVEAEAKVQSCGEVVMLILLGPLDCAVGNFLTHITCHLRASPSTCSQ